MEQNKPVQVGIVELKVTWKWAWALWWRWMLFSVAFGIIIYVPLVVLLIVFEAWNY